MYKLLPLLLLLAGVRADAQGYFRLLTQPTRSYAKKIALFPNRDLLLGGSRIDARVAEQSRGLFFTRFDPCGKTVWANHYDWQGNFMEFRDVKINAKGEAFVLGSAYQGLDEFIFLIKLNGKGEVMRWRMFRGQTVDHFTYSLDLQDGNILINGLLHDWVVRKRGFVAIFDETLNYRRGTGFQPSESTGAAIFTRTGDWLCRAGPYLTKLDAQGNLLWAKTLRTSAGPYPAAGPFEIADGYLFSFYHAQRLLFFAVSSDGQLRWKSAQVPAANAASAFTLLPDGRVLVAYNCPEGDQMVPCQLFLTPEGQLSGQQRLRAALPLRTGALDQTVDTSATIHLLANADLQAGETGTDVLLQFSPQGTPPPCFDWESFQDWQPADINLTLQPHEVVFAPLNINMAEETRLTVTPLLHNWAERCDLAENRLTRLDTTLNCGENWTVSLPGPDFRWEDDVRDNPRQLDQTGLYRAVNNNCLQPRTLEFGVTRTPCPCTVYLPNAIRPGTDDLNASLRLFSSCPVASQHLTVYNRWGGVMFEGTTPDAGWNGRSKGRLVEPGVYFAIARYELTDQGRTIQTGTVTQTITVVR
jgi:CHU_C Type IX secretion signal domain